MLTKARILHVATRVVTGGLAVVLGRATAARLRAHVVEDVIPVLDQATPAGDLKFFCPGPTPEWRARELLTKEPDTITWLDAFRAGDVLWDVGANVGAYTLYAALKGATVLAFEPSPANYYVLGRNIELNGFSERISSYCLAFSDETGLNRLFMASTDPGSALSNFGRPIDWKGDAFTPVHSQAMLGFTVDEFMARFHPTAPTHMKIDVDGNEYRILAGAANLLASKALRSVLVELNPAEAEEYSLILDLFRRSGLELASRVSADTSAGSEFSRAYNCIFRRSDA